MQSRGRTGLVWRDLLHGGGEDEPVGEVCGPRRPHRHHQCCRCAGRQAHGSSIAWHDRQHPGGAGEVAWQAWRARRARGRTAHFIPCVSISIRFWIGGIQQIGKVGLLTVLSSSSISFAWVMPLRHALLGLKRIVVTNISKSAGSAPTSSSQGCLLAGLTGTRAADMTVLFQQVCKVEPKSTPGIFSTQPLTGEFPI